MIPFVPIIEKGEEPFAMFTDLRHPRRWWILFVNSAFWWSIIGWLIALLWSLRGGAQSEESNVTNVLRRKDQDSAK